MAPQHTAASRQRHPGAAAQQPQRHAADAAWLLLLQHDSVRTQLPLVCKLLCCSKSLAAAVAEHSAGQLDIPDWATRQAAPWLRKHARLARSLDLGSDSARMSVSALVVAGLQTLMLQSLKGCTHKALPVLEQLPASRLTELDLTLQGKDANRSAFAARVSAALGRLTALRSLALTSRGAGAAPLSGLSALTQLTALSLAGPLANLQHVPPQLLELKLDTDEDDDGDDEQQPLELQRLTALTALTCPLVQAADALPANLRVLDCCMSVGAVSTLAQLQQLQLRIDYDDTDVTAIQMRQLSRLTSLSLNYSPYETRDITDPSCAAAWPLLPLLRRLAMLEVIPSAPTCQLLAQLSGLTSLVLQSHGLDEDGDYWAEPLAAALRRLSGLQHLELADPFWPARGAAITQEEPAEGIRQLLQAVGSLPQLHQLDINGLAQLAAAAGANGSSLTALTGLTSLSLAGCELTEAAVASIVSQLPRLRSLDCSANETFITDAALVAITQLQQLTGLVLRGVATDAGLQHLSGLTRLRQLDVATSAAVGGSDLVSYAGLCHLTALTRLQHLCVPVAVTRQQPIRRVQQLLPHLTTLEYDW